MKIVLTKDGTVINPGGISVFIFELSNALIREGHDVHVISGSEVPGTQATLTQMFDVKKLPNILTLQESQTKSVLHSQGLARGIKQLFLWLFRGQQLLNVIAPDILIVNGIIPLRSSALKVVVCHDLEFRQSIAQKFYDKVLYQTFDLIAATSTELSQAVHFELGIKSSKVITMPICIDTQKYTVLAQEEREHAILHVGTWADKNLETTVSAFSKLAKTDTSIKLYIVGDPWKGHEKMLAKAEGKFPNRIHCLGMISKKELNDLFSRVKVTSVPSIYRVPVLSPTVLESLASGTPVVGGSTAISSDLLKDGYNGFKVCPTDFNMLSQRISKIINSKELWDMLSTNAKTVAKNFDASVVARRYVRLCESLKR